jgi:hypothetical protein
MRLGGVSYMIFTQHITTCHDELSQTYQNFSITKKYMNSNQTQAKFHPNLHKEDPRSS